MQTLVIDPVPNMGQILRGVLYSVGSQGTFVAKDVYKGIKVLLEEDIGLVICEEALEPISGLRLVEALRWAEDSRHREIPFILSSSAPTEALIAEAIDLGVDDVLAKPFSLNAVKARYQRIVNRRAPFVECGVYVGPDRRRRDLATVHEERRSVTDPAKPIYKRRTWDFIRPPAESRAEAPEPLPEKKTHSVERPRDGERRLPLVAVKPGMVLMRECRTDTGFVVAGLGTSLGPRSIGRLKDLTAAGQIDGFVYVEAEG